MRRTQHGHAIDIASIEQLPRNEAAFDRLADADIVRDEKANGVELQRHQERHELVSSWLDGDLSEAAERPCAPAQRKQEGIAKEQRAVMPRLLAGVGWWEGSLGDRLRFEPEVDDRAVFFRAGDRTYAQ